MIFCLHFEETSESAALPLVAVLPLQCANQLVNRVVTGILPMRVFDQNQHQDAVGESITGNLL